MMGHGQLMTTLMQWWNASYLHALYLCTSFHDTYKNVFKYIHPIDLATSYITK